jgi:hypothetical protein
MFIVGRLRVHPAAVLRKAGQPEELVAGASSLRVELGRLPVLQASLALRRLVERRRS